MDPAAASVQAPALRSLFTNLPRLSRLLVALIAVLHLVYLAAPSVGLWFSLQLNYVFSPPLFFLRLLTAGFLELSTVAVLLNGATLLLLGKFLEPIWGSKEYLKFVLLLHSASGAATFFVLLLAYMLSGREWLLYAVWCGTAGLQLGLLVMLKQLLPDHVLWGVRFKYLPLLVLSLQLLAVGVGLSSARSLPFAVFGFYFGWLYLRFFQRSVPASGGPPVVGDLSEAFAFVTFFPEPLHPFVAPVCNVLFVIASLTRVLKLCGGNAGGAAGSASGFSFEKSDTTMSDSLDADRRRARAARALEQRLAQLERTPDQQTPPQAGALQQQAALASNMPPSSVSPPAGGASGGGSGIDV